MSRRRWLRARRAGFGALTPLRYVRTRNLHEPAVAFDLTPLQNSHRFRGIGTYVRGLASRLVAQTDVPIEFWAWKGVLDLNVAPPHRLQTMRRIPMPAYRGAWAFAQGAMRMRMRRGPAVVHITDPNALVTMRGRVVMTTAYDLIPYKEGLRHMRVIARTGYRSYLRALGHTDLLFAISEQTASDLAQLLDVPRERIRIAPPGVDLPATEPGRRVSERPYFLFLGGPNPNKNRSVVLGAMRLCSDLPEELVVAGR